MRLNRAEVLASSLLAPRATYIPPEPPRAESTRQKAARQRKELLLALRMWGHLRCSDVARLLWPKATYGQQMAQRLTKRLAASGELLARKNGWGMPSWVMTRVGAAAVEAFGHDCSHGLDIGSVSGPTFAHRAMATRFGIEKELEGLHAYGEHAIFHGFGPFGRELLGKRFGKLPDLLLVEPDSKQVWWVEVESAAKPTAELLKCFSVSDQVGASISACGTYKLAGLIFAFDGSQGHAKRLVNTAKIKWAGKGGEAMKAVGRKVSLAYIQLDGLGGWKGYKQLPIYA